MVAPDRIAGFVMVLAALGLAAGGAALAQERPESPATHAAGSPPEAATEAEAGGWRPWHGPLGGHRLAQRLFSLRPEDRGPLRPGEGEELLEFAREHAPRIHAALEQLREQGPEDFARKLSEYAPRLRHLKRIFEYSPRLGRLIRAHADGMFRMQRLRRALEHAPPGSALRGQLEQELRARLAESVALELEVLEVLAGELEERRDQRVAERVAALLAPDADLTAEPEAVRGLVAACHAAADGAERDAQRTRLMQAATRQVDAELDALRERIRQMRGAAAEEVDRRLERMLSGGPPSRPGRGPPPPEGRPGPRRPPRP